MILLLPRRSHIIKKKKIKAYIAKTSIKNKVSFFFFNVKLQLLIKPSTKK